jgi:hypothetical protein
MILRMVLTIDDDFDDLDGVDDDFEDGFDY